MDLGDPDLKFGVLQKVDAVASDALRLVFTNDGVVVGIIDGVVRELTTW